MFGGIPTSEVDGLERYWDAFPCLREELFKQVNPAVVQFTCSDIDAAIKQSASVNDWRNKFTARFADLETWLFEELVSEVSLVLRDVEEDRLTDELFRRLEGLSLIDRYDVYQALDDEWQQMAVDLEILQTEGFDAVRRVDPRMVMKKQRGKDVEVQDGWIGRVLPFDLVQQILQTKEAALVDSLERRLPAIASEIAEIVEGLTDEEKSDASEALNEASDAFIASKLKGVVKSLRAELGGEACHDDSLPSRLENAAKLFDEERAVKRELKELRAALDANTKAVIEGIDDDQARELLGEKWIRPLIQRFSAIPDDIIKTFVDKLRGLSEKYATTYADIDKQIQDAEMELVSMLGNLTGNEFDMAGIRELAALLGGEVR